MRHSGWRWVAVSSLLIAALANAETRPRYGGVVQIEMRAAPESLDPAANHANDSFAGRNLAALMFDTLVTFDEDGNIRPALADSWQMAAQQLKIHIRRGVTFHDGASLTVESVAASLKFANPAWNVVTDADSVMIQGDISVELLAELALPRNAILKRDSEKLNGTGPFHISEWQSGNRLTLAAFENCWRGRPFLDAIEIEMGKSYRDQMNALGLGRADLIEVSPEQVRRVSQDRRRVATSMPIELVALLFARDATSAEENSLRTALALSIDRTSIRDVLLQGTGQATGAILPTWMSGYGFVFPAGADLAKARQLRGQASSPFPWKLGYNADDPLDRLLAERVALNARDAGLAVQTTSTAGADMRIAHFALETDAWSSLTQVANQMGASLPKKYSSIDDLYSVEQGLIASGRIIPLLHLPVSYAASPSLQNWTVRSDGTLRLEDAWQESGRP